MQMDSTPTSLALAPTVDFRLHSVQHWLFGLRANCVLIRSKPNPLIFNSDATRPADLDVVQPVFENNPVRYQV
jgi:hypothetical protein